MSERVQVRRMTATVTVTRDSIVVLPVGITEKEAIQILRASDLNEITDGQDADIAIDEGVRVAKVDVEAGDDLYIITDDGLVPAGDTEWTAEGEIGKYLVKEKSPTP